MSKLFRVMTCVLAGAALGGATIAIAQQPAPSSGQPSANSADRNLKALYDGYAAWDAKESGVFMNESGELKPTDYLPRVDVPVAAPPRRASQAAARSIERDLSGLAFAGRTGQRRDLQDRPGERADRGAFSHLGNAVQQRQLVLDLSRFVSAVRQCSRVPALHRQAARHPTLFRRADRQHARGPRPRLQRAAGDLGRPRCLGRAFASRDVAKSPFYKPFETMPSTIPAREQLALRDEGVRGDQAAGLPAYEKLLVFIRDEYMAKARATVSAHDLPDGDAFYRAQIREFTTLDMTPEEIHQLGLREVARIDARDAQDDARQRLHGTFDQFLKFLKTDPQFYARTPDQLMGVSAYVAKRVDGKIGTIFGLLPRRRFGIIRCPMRLRHSIRRGAGPRELPDEHL